MKRQTSKCIQWDCVVRGKINPCRATVRQVSEAFTKGPNEHNHPGTPALLQKVKVSQICLT
jgi:hypothetical protein